MSALRDDGARLLAAFLARGVAVTHDVGAAREAVGLGAERGLHLAVRALYLVVPDPGRHKGRTPNLRAEVRKDG